MQSSSDYTMMQQPSPYHDGPYRRYPNLANMLVQLPPHHPHLLTPASHQAQQLQQPPQEPLMPPSEAPAELRALASLGLPLGAPPQPKPVRPPPPRTPPPPPPPLPLPPPAPLPHIDVGSVLRPTDPNVAVIHHPSLCKQLQRLVVASRGGPQPLRAPHLQPQPHVVGTLPGHLVPAAPPPAAHDVPSHPQEQPPAPPSQHLPELRAARASEAWGKAEDATREQAYKLYLAGQYAAAAVKAEQVLARLMNTSGRMAADMKLLLAAATYCLGDFERSVALNMDVIAEHPSMPEAYSNLAHSLKARGNVELCIHYYQKAIQLDPAFVHAHVSLGLVYSESGLYDAAAGCLQAALKLNPHDADLYKYLSNLYLSFNQHESARQSLVQGLAARPDAASLWLALAKLCSSAGQTGLADMYYGEAAKRNASLAPPLLGQLSAAQAYVSYGQQHASLGAWDKATPCFLTAISLAPNYPRPYQALAQLCKQQGRLQEALMYYTQAVTLDPPQVDIASERAALLKDMSLVNEAIVAYQQAIALNPGIPELYVNLAGVYKDSGRHDEAIVHYRKALELRPDFPDALCNMIHSLQCVCDWTVRDEWFARLEETVYRQIMRGDQPSVQPFHAVAYPMNGSLALEISRKYAERVALVACSLVRSSRCCANGGVDRGETLAQAFVHPPPRMVDFTRGERLRVGYVSSDFGNHPLAHLMMSVFGLHDRSKLEVFCYALSCPDGSEWQRCIAQEVEHFVDVHQMSVPEIARRCNEDGIQVLVNLNGYTQGARNEVFALEPCPVQISYMGFPSTTGADYINYLFVDKVVCPARYKHFFSETLVHLPNCYFVNAYRRRHQDVLLPQNLPTRASVGLPTDKVIFCCFNQLYKMGPGIVKSWCRILLRVPNAVLWLLRFPPAGESRLRSFMERQGVPPHQILFTNVAGKDDHIRRSALADLFLDTPLCNAHTTGTDVLWAGCPILTLPLERMATRVASSLLHAAGLGDMVVSSIREYEEKAVFLGNNPLELERLKRRLRDARLTCPLFDTDRWVKNLDKALLEVWARHCRGLTPRGNRPAAPIEIMESDEDDEEAPAGLL
mmetsp:Transcript_6922/g.25504  ORF Transcript_6922/g.25504 Transcript_6922/m.25504 type:complete len:1080 (-) Transcript_6922:134-3373(-)